MMFEELLKKAPNSFCFTSALKEMRRLHTPFLEKWGFASFHFSLCDKSGKLVYFTNDFDYVMDYWQASLPMDAGFSNDVADKQSYSGLLDGMVRPDILEYTREKGCYSGFGFVDRYYDALQFMTFFSKRPLEDAKGFFLRHQLELRNWTLAFVWQMRNLIAQAALDPLQFPEEIVAPQKPAFYPERSLGLRCKGIQSTLTFRELDCLALHTKGFTYTAISALLKISIRTVETHIESVKNRFGLSSRDELAQLAYTNPLIQNYAPRLS